MKEIQGKSILIQVRARFRLTRVRVIGSRLYVQARNSLFYSKMVGIQTTCVAI